jgi:hypothetical protein
MEKTNPENFVGDFRINAGTNFLSAEPAREIFRIHADGSVTLRDGVAVGEASRLFWERVSLEGKSLVAERDALREENARLRAAASGRPLMGLEEYEGRKAFARANASATGIACPECGGELYRTSCIVMASIPPQADVVCERCGRVERITL